VIPYIKALQLDAEDALQRGSIKNKNANIKRAVLALPRISNHNDFDALGVNSGIDFTWVGPKQTILPATSSYPAVKMFVQI